MGERGGGGVRGTGAGSREEREREMYGKRDPQGSGKWEKSGTTRQRCVIFRRRKKSHKAVSIKKKGGPRLKDTGKGKFAIPPNPSRPDIYRTTLTLGMRNQRRLNDLK